MLAKLQNLVQLLYLLSFQVYFNIQELHTVKCYIPTRLQCPNAYVNSTLAVGIQCIPTAIVEFHSEF